jgi:bile-acid 7alpha-dehydratase
MADLQDIDARIGHLEDIEAIKRLKYKYFRCLDTKALDELAECFIEDVITSYSDGQYSLQGIYAIMKFIKRGLARYDFFGLHHGQHPEIELTGDATARGTWALYNYMINTEKDRCMLIGAFYHDEYVKINGEWKIKSTGYRRIFEEAWDRGDTPSLNLKANMFASLTEPL